MRVYRREKRRERHFTHLVYTELLHTTCITYDVRAEIDARKSFNKLELKKSNQGDIMSMITGGGKKKKINALCHKHRFKKVYLYMCIRKFKVMKRERGRQNESERQRVIGVAVSRNRTTTTTATCIRHPYTAL